MPSQLTTVSKIKRTLSVTVPRAEIDSGVKIRLAEVAKNARLPGFRPGKAPFEVVVKQFGPGVRSEIITKLIEKSYTEALAEHKVTPAGMPKITVEESSFQDGDLRYKADVEVFPEFKVEGMDKMELVKTNATVTEKDVDKMFENLRKQHITWEKVAHAATTEDRVTIDFEGFKNNEAFAGGSAKDFKLVLGSKTMVPGFEEGLTGKKAGESFDLTLTFPKDYHVTELKNQPVVFKMTVKEVEAPALPEVNDEFAKLFEVNSLEELRREVTLNMERELEFTLKAKLKEQVIEGLLKHNEIELPESLVEQESHHLRETAMQRMKNWNKQQAPAEMPLDLFKQDAERRVALGLIMNRVIEEHNIKPDATRIDAMIEKMASVYDNPAEVVQFLRQNKAKMAEIRQIVIEEQVVDQVAQRARIKEETKKFDEVMQNNHAAMSNILPQG